MAEQATAICFLLNGERHDVPPSTPAHRTVLQYLREDLALKGSKEGCAEGDCGACTVTVEEIDDDDDIITRAVNACILFLPHLHGRSVVTVEGLSRTGESLHPCQQAMVDTHGSQCGFCTPGIVMSLYTGWRADGLSNDAAINDALAGNLCRCTGYSPIAAAARQLSSLAKPARERDAANARHAALFALRDSIAGDLAVDHGKTKSYAPTTLADFAARLQEDPDATIVAGATDVGLWVTKRQRRFPVMLYTHRVRELQAMHQTNGMLRIGAAVRLADVLPAVASRWPDFEELLRRYGSAQVRHSGTLGGNIANGSPIGDGAPVLIALGAAIVLQHGEAQRRLPLEEFFIAYGKQDRRPGEFVRALEVPLTTAAGVLSCHKVSKRFDQDISAICGCFNLRVAEGQVAAARIAFGGMAATPKRALHVERALTGKPWTLATVEQAIPAFAQDYTPISDMRASAEYRLQVAGNLLLRTFHEHQLGAANTRLVGPGATILDAVLA